MTLAEFEKKYDVNINILWAASFRTPTKQSDHYIGRKQQYTEQELVDAVISELDYRNEKIRKQFRKNAIRKARILKKWEAEKAAG